MNLLEEALFYDAQKSPVQAALKYEKSIEGNQANLDSYINLAVLYFVCNDFGYQAANKLPDDFVIKSWNRVFKVIEEANVKYGNLEEIAFWSIYFRFILKGEDPMYDKCFLLAQRGEILIPYFHLYAESGDEKYCIYAEKLFEIVKNGETEKNRYIKSVLEGIMKRRNLDKMA